MRSCLKSCKLRIAALFLSLVLFLPLLAGCILENLYFYSTGEKRTLTDFNILAYSRPNTEDLSEQIDTMLAMLKSSDIEGDSLLAPLEGIVNAYYYDFPTMHNLAFVNYARDMTSEELRDEYYTLTEQMSLLSVKLEELYVACAASPYRDFFENELMGNGFFDGYEGDYTVPKELLVLLEQENTLTRRYSEALMNPSVTYEGVTYTEDTVLAIEDPSLYNAVCEAYYDTMNTRLGGIFVELVGVRREIARYLGYTNYAEYAFEALYGREYSVADAERYLAGIRHYVTPIYASLSIDAIKEWAFTRFEATTEELLEHSGNLATAISPYLGKRFEEMVCHNLYTVAASNTMYYGSFQTYFDNYDTPYLFVNGTGDLYDVMSIMHEFGHYTSAYLNYGMIGSNDEAEVASQGLELLSTRYLAKVFSDEEAVMLAFGGMYSMLASFNECGAYTAFENLVYADPDLTIEECNEYYRACAEEHALIDISESGLANGRDWVFINHLFEYPYYMIGYSVAADVAVQLYELEVVEEGSGVQTYLDLIDLAYNYNFFGNLNEVGLESPFAEGRAERVAAVFEKELQAYKNKG